MQGGIPGIEPGTASTLKKNHTARLNPHPRFYLYLNNNNKEIIL